MYLANTSTGTIRVFGNNEGQQNVEVGSGSVSDLQVMTGSRGYLLVVVALDLVSDSFFQLDNASSLDSSMNVITNELRDVSIVMNASDTHFRTTATQAINLSIQATTFFSTVEMSNLLSMHAEMPTLWNFGGSSWPWQFDKCQVSGDVDLRVGAGACRCKERIFPIWEN